MEGHLKLGARYYSPTTARFTQPDPSGKEAKTYNYASCNPANRTDPNGLIDWGDVGEFAGGIITCVGAGRVGAYVGAGVGTFVGPEGTVAGAVVGFTYGCAAGIISAQTTGFAPSM